MGTAVWAALSNTSCECVVAKANKADCFANAEDQTREEGGQMQYSSYIGECPKGRGDVAF